MSHMTNPLATVDQLYKYKSLSALPQDLQDTIFYQVQLLTQAAGLLLRLPQSVTAQANILLARYLVNDTAFFQSHEPSHVSAASLFLAAKLSAHPATPRDLSNVYTYLLSSSSPLFRASLEQQPTENNPSAYYLSETAYTKLHNKILSAESRILASLSFDTHVALPHPLAITYLQALDFLSQPKGKISQRTVEYLNTALLSPQCLYVTHQPNQLAVAAIYNAAKDLGAKMPECAWWEVFDVDREELGFLVVGMRSLEGSVRRMTSEGEDSRRAGVITRAAIEAEMNKKGISIMGNGIAKKEVDEEDLMMREMDEMTAQMET
ncbi:putative Cyclin domain-containing protein [Seiridium cardinale]|uniref:Cyclin domain-containing protein n=1 Tax=Seiridium cardinale TaxID=138064 RepID=A0ABR2XM56_9PEZI